LQHASIGWVGWADKIGSPA